MTKNIQRTILIVDDDEAFRETLCSGLENLYTVVPAANAKEAMAIVNRTHVDLLLTDIRMPGMTGYELLGWIDSHLNRKIPFIIMTGYHSTGEDQENSVFLIQQDRSDIFTLSKPFKLAQLKRLIDARLSQSPQEELKASEESFCKVPINDIVIRQVLDFDIYLKLSEQNFIKVAHKDEVLPLGQIKKFKEKGVNYLYIRKDEFYKFVEFTLDLAAAVSKSSQIPSAKKIAFLDYANKIMMEKVFNEGLDEESFNAVVEFAGLSVNTVLQSHEIMTLLEILKDTSEKVFTDSFATALYSMLIAREMNFESSLTAFKLCIAGLFQDIGKKEIEKYIIEKDPKELTSKEADILQSHVVRSQQILESLNCIHSDIIRIIQEHHEDMDGRGYPFGKKKAEQHPLSRILQCSNVFIDNINMFKNRSGRVDVAAILSDVEKNHKTRLDADCMKALRSLFKLPAMGAETN